MTQRVLFSGYYGLNNAGDEAVLEASVGLFRARRPELSLVALSADPAGTRARLGMEALPRMQPAAVLPALRRCALFLSGGGSLLQDRTSLKSLLYYLLLLRLAKLAGARTMVFAQGIGPLVRPAARRVTRAVLTQVDAITVRDAESADLLREIGLGGSSAPPVEITADPVFGLAPTVTERVRELAPGRPAVAVALRPWPGIAGMLPALAEALSTFPREIEVQCWPMQPEMDLPVCSALAESVPGARVLRASLNPGEWMALAGWVDAVLGMRLHALIFGAARAVPVLGISYDPKVDALLGRLRSRSVGTALRLDGGALRVALSAALSDDEERRREREARAAHLSAAAERNVECALELLA